MLVRHSGQHLDLHFHAQVLGEHEGEPHVEKVVRGHADLHRAVASSLQEPLEHGLVRGIRLGLGQVGRLGPAAQFGISLFHGQVGALHQPHADRWGASPVALRGEGKDALERLVAPREVGLQGDPGRVPRALLPAQRPEERLQGEVEVAVLLHVKVDELGGLARSGGVEKLPERAADALHRTVEVDE